MPRLGRCADCARWLPVRNGALAKHTYTVRLSAHAVALNGRGTLQRPCDGSGAPAGDTVTVQTGQRRTTPATRRRR
jgi:hypothetical protein